jgi:Zn finger protein HypA/HybF involved in hydrogenase expression
MTLKVGDNMRDTTKCWYCEERPKKKEKDAIFCEECEKIRVKDVRRSEIENFFYKV